jgi:hypothetical protein
MLGAGSIGAVAPTCRARDTLGRKDERRATTSHTELAP